MRIFNGIKTTIIFDFYHHISNRVLTDFNGQYLSPVTSQVWYQLQIPVWHQISDYVGDQVKEMVDGAI